MNEDAPFIPPEVTDGDVRRASRLLGLSEDAFHGKNGDDPRLEVLQCSDSLDVTACPGSGKTTLLVAKLAILGAKWEHRTRGICVLSHTNAARHEVEKRLGSTSVGRCLLSYPHYVGTIHRFVNEYIAMPWLRALGYPVVMVDDDEVERRRRSLLRSRRFVALRSFVDKREKHQNVVRGWSVASSKFDVQKAGGLPAFKTPGPASEQLKSLVEIVIRDGYHCHDEMFVWAGDMLDKVPIIVDVIRDRFPLVFIDETQDNSEDQSVLLERIFNGGNNPVIRQRFGDSNQAIYKFVEGKGASTDIFPCDDHKASVPNSYRFGTGIANLAGPLGLDQDGGGLKGTRPKKICDGSCAAEGPHTIFLFKENSTTHKVLSEYADLLIATFSPDELAHGTFAAVGQVHKNAKDDYKPRHVGHYWPEYDAELSKADPQPKTFVQYVRAGQAEADAYGETSPAVEKIAQGVLRLARMADGGQAIKRVRRYHRYVLDLLDAHSDERGCYARLLRRFGSERCVLSEEAWKGRWSNAVRTIGERIAGCSLSTVEADAFLLWDDEPGQLPLNMAEKAPRDNIYRYPADDPKVRIKVGSVHSVKGQTHTATLVLETFWYDHNLESLLDWLLSKRSGGKGAAVRPRSRLKVHYVAMTRPTHLLCLAMKQSTFENKDGELNETAVQTLRDRGWNVKLV